MIADDVIDQKLFQFGTLGLVSISTAMSRYFHWQQKISTEPNPDHSICLSESISFFSSQSLKLTRSLDPEGPLELLVDLMA